MSTVKTTHQQLIESSINDIVELVDQGEIIDLYALLNDNVNSVTVFDSEILNVHSKGTHNRAVIRLDNEYYSVEYCSDLDEAYPLSAEVSRVFPSIESKLTFVDDLWDVQSVNMSSVSIMEYVNSTDQIDDGSKKQLI